MTILALWCELYECDLKCQLTSRYQFNYTRDQSERVAMMQRYKKKLKTGGGTLPLRYELLHIKRATKCHICYKMGFSHWLVYGTSSQ